MSNKVIEFKFEPQAPRRTVMQTLPENDQNDTQAVKQPFIEIIDASSNNFSSIEFKFSNEDDTKPRPTLRSKKFAAPPLKPVHLSGAPVVANKPLKEIALVFGGQDERPADSNRVRCWLCSKHVNKNLRYELKSCHHSFCKSCLCHQIKKVWIDSGFVKCPIEKCVRNLGEDDLAAILGGDHHEFAERMKEAAEERRKLKAQEEIYKMIEDDVDFIENYEEFECSVCYMEIEISGGLILKECIHKFCSECLIGQIKSSEDYEVKCLEEGCKKFLSELEIRRLLSKEDFEKHHEKSLRRYKGKYAKELKQCLVPDCIGVIEADENVYAFVCPTCSTPNCLKCKAVHRGKTCQQFQDEINSSGKRQKEIADSENAIKDLVARNQAMYCPQCEIPVMKEDGCDYITCTACDLGICWRTKKPRHPIKLKNGKVVDGCHCKENGKKCHPDCRNCH